MNRITKIIWMMITVACCFKANALVITEKGIADSLSIRSFVNSFQQDQVILTQAGYQYWFVDKSMAGGKTLKMSVVEPGSATHAPHRHDEDEFFLFLKEPPNFTSTVR